MTGLRLPHLMAGLTVRTRLTAWYSGLFLAVGVSLLGIIYLLQEDTLDAPSGEVLVTRNLRALLHIDKASDGPIQGISKQRVDQLVNQLRTDSLHHLLIDSGIAIGVLAVVCIAIGWWLAGRTLAPLHRITMTARRLSSQTSTNASSSRDRPTSSRNSPTPSTPCWPGWRTLSPARRRSSRTSRTNCARRWPSSEPRRRSAWLAGNLVHNAIRYNHAGGRVEITVTPEDGLRVVSTGPVIPQERVTDLFQPFHRLGSARTGSEGGAGLGLSIVRSIARAHRARVIARAGEAGGLDVCVSFTAVPEPGNLLSTGTQQRRAPK